MTKLRKTLDALREVARALGHREIARAVAVASDVARSAPASNVADAVARILDEASISGTVSRQSRKILTAQRDLLLLAEPKKSTLAQIDAAFGLVELALVDPNLAVRAQELAAASRHQASRRPMSDSTQRHVAALSDSTLSEREYEERVASFFGDKSVNAAEQKRVVGAITGLAQRDLGNPAARRDALLRWFYGEISKRHRYWQLEEGVSRF